MGLCCELESLGARLYRKSKKVLGSSIKAWDSKVYKIFRNINRYLSVQLGLMRGDGSNILRFSRSGRGYFIIPPVVPDEEWLKVNAKENRSKNVLRFQALNTGKSLTFYQNR